MDEESDKIFICPANGFHDCVLGYPECFYLDCELYHFVFILSQKFLRDQFN
jgi:hypothetical protein